MPPHYWNTTGVRHKVCYSLISNRKLAYPYYDKNTKIVVLRKTRDHYETLVPVVGAYQAVDQVADTNVLRAEKKGKLFKVAKDLGAAFAATQTQKASIVHDGYEILRAQMLQNNWPAKNVDDLLMQESCCCGCKIAFPRLFFKNIDRSGNNISTHHLSSYHFCSVTNKRLAAAFCSFQEEAGRFSVCLGCASQKSNTK